VICDNRDEQVYQLRPTMDEIELIGRAARYFKINCVGMAQRYQRHLVYQAAALKNDKGLQKGPGHDMYLKAIATAPTFVLSARSGWYAVARARKFLEDIGPQFPVETFQVGRVDKDRQIAQILSERKDDVYYFEDRKEHVDRVLDRLSDDQKSRLKCFVFEPLEQQMSEEQVRKIFEETVNNALNKN
jgi:hypothetical protein